MIADPNRSLLELAARAKQPGGTGTGALFAGPGSVAAVRALANRAGRPLYRVDLSAVIRKYIGETEKNLELVFSAAQAADAILFFDEADALFGQRSAVKDSHDRFANVELNYLLQRMERFRGVVVLATNRKIRIDATLRERLPYVVVLADGAGSAAAEIVADNIDAIGVIYVAAMLEACNLFAVVDHLAARFASGLLPLGRGTVGERICSRWSQAQARLSEADRRNVYQRTLGLPGGAPVTTPNREFNHLWIRFVAAVAESATEQTSGKAGRDLAANLSRHGYGMSYFVANTLREHARGWVALLSDSDLRADFGANDMWQVVDQATAGGVGRPPHGCRYATMAVAGARVFHWLATHATALRRGRTSRVTVALVAACQQWRAAAGGKVGGIAAPAAMYVRPSAREILAALRSAPAAR